MSGDEGAIARQIHWALQSYRADPDWEDIRQEAWLSVCARWPARPAHVAESTFVVNVARWAALTYLRRRRRCREILTPDLEAAPAMEPEACFADDRLTDLHERVRASVLPRYWRLFRGHYVEGISQTELARREGVSTSCMQQIISTVRNRYRQALGLPEKGWGPAKLSDRNRRRLAERADYRARRNARGRDYMRRKREQERAGAA